MKSPNLNQHAGNPRFFILRVMRFWSFETLLKFSDSRSSYSRDLGLTKALCYYVTPHPYAAQWLAIHVARMVFRNGPYTSGTSRSDDQYGWPDLCVPA
ncbi:hypothetical protein FNV43_RR12495 [Rhamnella rubrinervis]|uniref:Uncharacterized protein n=1 Tax=Rhamnella rubrinervis TaxID=2594499 RepID=A0A8K0H7U1_9ROSA|nr:hypothetical protein FNV43_RR12495 [Rhamnella rubrinervis]